MVKKILIPFIIGTGAFVVVFIFMMSSTPLVTSIITAIIFGVGGLWVGKIQTEILWYSPLLMNIILWLAFVPMGMELFPPKIHIWYFLIPPMVGLVSSYIGMFYGIRYFRAQLDSKDSVKLKSYNNTLSILGALSLVPALLIWGLWIYVFSVNIPDAKKTELYMSYFPAFLQSREALSNIVLLSSLVSILLSSFGLKRANIYLKVVGTVIIIIGCLVTLLQLFSMM